MNRPGRARAADTDVGKYLRIVDALSGRSHRPDGSVARALHVVLDVHRADVLAEMLNGVDLVCAGTPVDRNNQPAGPRCGNTYTGPVDAARFAGWRVGDPTPHGARPVMCPRCAHPDRAEPETCGQTALEPLPGM